MRKTGDLQKLLAAAARAPLLLLTNWQKLLAAAARAPLLLLTNFARPER